jgi:hypothetical protein
MSIARIGSGWARDLSDRKGCRVYLPFTSIARIGLRWSSASFLSSSSAQSCTGWGTNIMPGRCRAIWPRRRHPR